MENVSGVFNGAELKRLRLEAGLSLEDVAARCGLHRTSIGLIERGEREPTIDSVYRIAHALGMSLRDIIVLTTETHYEPVRKQKYGSFYNEEALVEAHLSRASLKAALEHCYHILDIIDEQLLRSKSPRLSQVIELANLSSIVGNLLCAGLTEAAADTYSRNRPHAYPDLIRKDEPEDGLEVKVALEMNRPKGHLPKAGWYLTCRYVLGSAEAEYSRGTRGDVVWVWEVKVGHLADSDFDISNTDGDSGKTANISKNAFDEKMTTVYFDPDFNPYARNPYPQLVQR